MSDATFICDDADLDYLTSIGFQEHLGIQEAGLVDSVVAEVRSHRAMVERFECFAHHLELVGPCKICGDMAQEIRDRLKEPTDGI